MLDAVTALEPGRRAGEWRNEGMAPRQHSACVQQIGSNLPHDTVPEVDGEKPRSISSCPLSGAGQERPGLEREGACPAEYALSNNRVNLEVARSTAGKSGRASWVGQGNLKQQSLRLVGLVAASQERSVRRDGNPGCVCVWQPARPGWRLPVGFSERNQAQNAPSTSSTEVLSHLFFSRHLTSQGL